MTRIEIPVNNIGRNITLPPSWVTATGSEGMFFVNQGGNVLLEVISSTTGQSFNVITGLIVDNEWTVADDLVNVSSADEVYKLGPYPTNIYNQLDGSLRVYIDHSASAILQFKAWRLQ